MKKVISQRNEDGGVIQTVIIVTVLLAIGVIGVWYITMATHSFAKVNYFNSEAQSYQKQVADHCNIDSYTASNLGVAAGFITGDYALDIDGVQHKTVITYNAPEYKIIIKDTGKVFCSFKTITKPKGFQK